MKKLTLTASAVAILVSLSLSTGCTSMFGENSTLGNGQIDLPIDLSVEWHDALGNGFTLVNGTVTEATYKSVKTGLLYELTDTDGFAVTSPDGSTTMRLKLKDDTAAETTPEPVEAEVTPEAVDDAIDSPQL